MLHLRDNADDQVAAFLLRGAAYIDRCRDVTVRGCCAVGTVQLVEATETPDANRPSARVVRAMVRGFVHTSRLYEIVSGITRVMQSSLILFVLRNEANPYRLGKVRCTHRS